jgi:hypothetical protein
LADIFNSFAIHVGKFEVKMPHGRRDFHNLPFDCSLFGRSISQNRCFRALNGADVGDCIGSRL